MCEFESYVPQQADLLYQGNTGFFKKNQTLVEFIVFMNRNYTQIETLNILRENHTSWKVVV